MEGTLNSHSQILDELHRDFEVDIPLDADALIEELEQDFGDDIPEPRRTVLRGWRKALAEQLNLERSLLESENRTIRLRHQLVDSRKRTVALYEAIKLFEGGKP